MCIHHAFISEENYIHCQFLFCQSKYLFFFFKVFMALLTSAYTDANRKVTKIINQSLFNFKFMNGL